MKKKLLLTLLTAVCAVCCALGLAACNGGSETVAVESIALNQSTLALDIGESETLTVAYTPDNATVKSVTWTSSAPAVASVDNTGNVTAIADGTATVTATTANGKTATCLVTVNAPHTHNLTPVPAEEATCTTDGNIAYYTCDGCENYFSDANGANKISDKTSVVIPKGHTMTTYVAVEETCKASGNSAYYACDVCGKWYSDADGENEILDKTSVVIAQKQHNFVSGVCLSCGSKQPTEGVTYKVSEHGEYAYAYRPGTASDAQSVVIAEEYQGLPVTAIDNYAFRDCTNLEEIEIPDSVTDIGTDAFSGTAWYDNQPDGLVYAGKVLYKYKGTMPENTSVTIKEGTVGIADKAFYGELGYMFNGLISITFPDSLKFIGESAFYSCSNLTSVTIPDGVTAIGYGAFNYCSNLANVTVPDSVVSIGANAFGNTSWHMPETNGISYAGKVAYKFNSTTFTSTTLTLLEGTKGIAGSAFSACATLETAVIPDSVVCIGDNAFERCSNLTDVTIPGSVRNLNTYAFWQCKVRNLTLGNGIVSIGNYAFGNCTNLYEIALPGSIEYIGDSAFKSCTYLQTVNIPGNVKSIGANAFKDCQRLTDITIPAGVTVINENAFGVCYKLKTVIISGNVTELADNAFDSCIELETIVIPGTVTSIGEYAFRGCTEMTVYFKGTAADWDDITIGKHSTIPTVCYYSAEPDTDGNHWHYDTDGVTPVKW